MLAKVCSFGRLLGMIIPVTIGLEPGNAENAVDPFNLGTINPVGMTAFSTAQLDAQTIDPATVE